MNNKEEPKVHCIVLNKLPCDLVKGRTEWKLCKVFLTLSHSKQRIQDEKNTKRKYNPFLAFSVSNPSDTDRQTLNFNKGVVKDCLGFSVNGKTVAALVHRVAKNETQWVLTTSEYLKHFSEQKNLTIDTFFENEFEESKLERLLPSLFKLQSVCNRTEVVLASPIIKPPAGEGSSKKPQSSSKGHQCKGEKTKEKNTTAPKVVSKVVPSQSKGDLNGNYPAAQSKYSDDIQQKAEITVKESSPNNKQERESNVSLKCGHPTKEKESSTTPKIISKEKELPPESPEYDCEPSDFSDENPKATTPKVIVKVKKKVSEYDQKSKPDPVDKDQACAMPRVVIEVKENASEPDKVQKQNHQSKSHSSAGGDGKSEQNTISEKRENVSAATHDTGHRVHSRDRGTAKNFGPKGKGGCEGGRIGKGFNEKHPVKASAQKTVKQLGVDCFVNYPKTKQNSDPKKKDGYRGSSEKESPHSKAKRRTSSEQDCASPSKRQRLSTEGDTTIHKQPSGKYSSNEKRSDSQHQNVAKIPTKSRTGAGVHDSNENKGPSKLPSVPCLPSTTVPRKKPVSDSTTALKVVPKSDNSIPKLKNPREEPIGKHFETGAEVEGCLDDKKDRASQSAIDVTSRAGTSNSPVKRRTLASRKDECGDTKRRKHTSGSTNSLSNHFQGKFQRAASRSLSVDSGSIKTSKEHTKICHEGKIAEMKSSSKAMQAKGNHTARKGVLENEGKPQSKTVRSHSVESGRTKTVKEIDKTKIPLMNFSSNSEQAKVDKTANNGIFKNACGLDFRQNRENNPSVTKKDLSLGDNKSEPYDQTTTSQVDPESARFDLLGFSLNTRDSFLFNPEYQKEQSGDYNFMKAVFQSGLYGPTDSSKVQTLKSTTIQSMSNDTSLSHMKRGSVFSNREPQSELTKRPRTEEPQAEKLQDVPRRGESNGEKEAERKSSLVHCENPRRLSHHQNTPAGKLQKQLQNTQEKHSFKKRSEVTLLVGDTMLQHIQPEKFFETKHVVVIPVPGATVDYISKKITHFVRQENPSSVILHVGTNDLRKGIMHIAGHIESVGKLITETFPSVKKFTISSIIQRREDITGVMCAKVSDVNKILRDIQLKHGWDYIDNKNIVPEDHLGPDGIHLNAFGIEAFAANISKHLGLVQCGVQQAANNTGHVTKHQLPVHVTSEDNEKAVTSCEEDAAITTNMSKCMGSDNLPRRNTNQPFVPKDQPVASPEEPIIDTDNTATLQAKIRPVANSIPGKTNVEPEKVTLLIGDSMLESINPQKLSRTKQTELVVVPDARVDNIGGTISKHARNPNVDEVILHIGSKDLKDGKYTHREIATKIEAIGLTLETTCPHITTFTISGVIETFDYKRANSRNLNTLCKSSTLDHGWAFISNDNIYPTFHMKPFETKLKSCGTRLLALNIIEHLQYVKSERFKSVSQAPAMHGNNDQSSFKDSRPMHCQELIVPGKANKVPPEDPQADKRPPKNLKADRLPRKDLSRKKSCDDRLGFNAGTGNEPLDGEKGCSDGDHGQSQTCDERHLKPPRRQKHKLNKTNSWERPNPKSWPYGANQNHPDHKYDYSSARYSHSTTHGPTHVQNARHQNSLPNHAHGNLRCFYCRELGHKKADCPRIR